MSPDSFGYACVLLVARRGRRIHSCSLGFTPAHLCVDGFIRVRVVHSGAHRCRRVHSGSLRFTGARVGVAGLLRCCVGSLGSTEWQHRVVARLFWLAGLTRRA